MCHARCGADQVDWSHARIRTCQRHRIRPLGGSIPRRGASCAHRHVLYKSVFSGAPKHATWFKVSHMIYRIFPATQNAPAVGVYCDKTLVTRSPLLRGPGRFASSSASTIMRGRLFTLTPSTSRRHLRSKSTARRSVSLVCHLTALFVFSSDYALHAQQPSVSALS